MTIRALDFAEPFFTVRMAEREPAFRVSGKAILLNLAERPIRIRDQALQHLQSVVVADANLHDLDHAILVERFADHEDDMALFTRVREVWPSAYEVRGEERLKGVQHYMSPKIWVGQIGLTMYHSGSVPLNVGLHREHPFCPVPGYREVHTQVVGFGKMQQAREQDIATLYLEEPMAPGMTHRPMYDAQGGYPWHQYETITASIFMAVEMLPDGVTPPQAP